LSFVTQERENRTKNPRKKERMKKNFSTISMGKKRKTEVGDADGEGVKNNPEEIWPYFFGIIFNSFPN